MYRKDGYFLRAAVIQCLDRIFYEPYHDSCHRMVWKKHTYPIYFYTYQTHLNYLKVKIPSGFNNNPPLPQDLWNAITDGRGIGGNGSSHKALAIAYLHYIQTMVEETIAQILAAKDLSPEEEAAYQLCLENALKTPSETHTDKPKARRGRPPKAKDVRPTADTPDETARTPKVRRGRPPKAKDVRLTADPPAETAWTLKALTTTATPATTATTITPATTAIQTPFTTVTATPSGQRHGYPTVVTTATLPRTAPARCMYNDRPWLLLRMPDTGYGKTDSTTALPLRDAIARDISAFGTLVKRRPPT